MGPADFSQLVLPRHRDHFKIILERALVSEVNDAFSSLTFTPHYWPCKACHGGKMQRRAPNKAPDGP